MHTITRMLIWENVSILNINGIEMSIFDVSITATMTGKLLNVEKLCIELPSRIKMRVTQQTDEIFACTVHWTRQQSSISINPSHSVDC